MKNSLSLRGDSGSPNVSAREKAAASAESRGGSKFENFKSGTKSSKSFMPVGKVGTAGLLMSKSNEIKFVYPLSLEEGERLRVYALKSRGKILKFVVQFELKIEDHWRPVVRYDNAHGYSHKDIIHADSSVEKQPLSFDDFNTAFTFSIQDIKLNWQWYKFAYEREVERCRRKTL